MKKELQYFKIEGAFGGNQEWFTNVVMYIGGCGAATACDCCIYYALRRGMKELYPYDIRKLTKEDYKRFSQIMKPYIRPRVGGVKKLEWFIDGFQNYIKDVNRKTNSKIQVTMRAFEGTQSVAKAKEFVKRQIDLGIPVPCLLLKHKDTAQFQNYIWHWFLLVGYEEAAGELFVKTATYGHSDRFSLNKLWATGYEEKGGLIQLGTGEF